MARGFLGRADLGGEAERLDALVHVLLAHDLVDLAVEPRDDRREVSAGANKPTQVPSSKSYPSSFKVGTSGSAATRAGLAIASPLSVPCCTRLIIAGSELLTRSTWPPAAAPTAGPPPWNGTCTASTFASTLKK